MRFGYAPGRGQYSASIGDRASRCRLQGVSKIHHEAMTGTGQARPFLLQSKVLLVCGGFAIHGGIRSSAFTMHDRMLVTGGAGFIGSNFILQQMQDGSPSF